MKLILSLFFLFAFGVCVQSQVTSQRVIYTTLNPPTVCVAGKVYTNSTVKKSWLGGSDSSCNPYAMGSSAAPTDATYITQTPNATLSAEQALSTLPTGPLANTTTTGVLRGATATDQSIPVFGADAGSNDTYVVTLSPALSSYVIGTHLRFKANTVNTGACSVNFNGLGALAIKVLQGTTDPADGDIKAGAWIDGVIMAGSIFSVQSTLGNAAASGTTINSTDGVLPYRSSATVFGDSPITRVDANTVSFTSTAQISKSGTYGVYGNTSGTAGISIGPASVFYNSTDSHNFQINGGQVWVITTGGNLTAASDNAVDLGASGANRPRTGYFGTSVVAPAVSATTSLTIGGGTAILKHLSGTATLDFANLAAIGCEDLTITVTGAALGDTVALGVPNASVVANGTFTGWVSAADTVTVRFCTVVSGNPASGTFRADVWQH